MRWISMSCSNRKPKKINFRDYIEALMLTAAVLFIGIGLFFMVLVASVELVQLLALMFS